MGIKTYNPYTPSRRNMTGSDFSEITKTTPEKSLCVSLKKNSGRNNQGKITVRHHGKFRNRIAIGMETQTAPAAKQAYQFTIFSLVSIVYRPIATV